jgi:hypothetical protein
MKVVFKEGLNKLEINYINMDSTYYGCKCKFLTEKEYKIIKLIYNGPGIYDEFTGLKGKPIFINFHNYNDFNKYHDIAVNYSKWDLDYDYELNVKELPEIVDLNKDTYILQSNI